MFLVHEKTSAEFAGFPVNIFVLVEDYPKRKKNAHTEIWIVTTDLSLQFEEAREAAYLRWQIENNESKRLSHHAGTKTVYFSRDRAGAHAALGFGGFSTQFPSRPQSGSHDSRFPRPPYDPARSDFPSYGSDPDFSSCCLPMGNVTDEVIMKYIEEQSKMERDKDEYFKVDE